MRYLCALFSFALVFSGEANSTEIECGALFYKNGITAAFPVIKKREEWEWHKNKSPEYLWTAETGFYSNKKFTGNGFGFMVFIGSLNLENTPPQKGNIQNLVNFASKSAFLTKESLYYNNEKKRNQVKYNSYIFGKVVDDDLLMVGTLNEEAVRLAKTKNPTHMKLQAILPEKGESYTCFPRIDIVD